LDEIIDEIVDSFRQYFEFPAETVAHGFDEKLREEKISKVDIRCPDDIAAISAIDGGSNTVIRMPTAAVVFNRVYCNKYVGMSRQDFSDYCEFVSITKLVNEGAGCSSRQRSSQEMAPAQRARSRSTRRISHSRQATKAWT